MEKFIEIDNVFDDISDQEIVSMEYGTILKPKSKTKKLIINTEKILSIEDANPLNKKLLKISMDNGDAFYVEEEKQDFLNRLNNTKEEPTRQILLENKD